MRQPDCTCACTCGAEARAQALAAATGAFHAHFEECVTCREAFRGPVGPLEGTCDAGFALMDAEQALRDGPVIAAMSLDQLLRELEIARSTHWWTSPRGARTRASLEARLAELETAP